MDVKSWVSKLPTVAEVRPKQCVGCGLAATPVGERIRVQGHGKRERQAWGPAAPGATPEVREVLVRRYRCLACKALTTVVPCETLTKRLYTAPAVGWALALFGLLAATPSAIRRAVSPWRLWGLAAPERWTTLQRWAQAAASRCVA